MNNEKMTGEEWCKAGFCFTLGAVGLVLVYGILVEIVTVLLSYL
jgi:hypothetical protein